MKRPEFINHTQVNMNKNKTNLKKKKPPETWMPLGYLNYKLPIRRKGGRHNTSLNPQAGGSQSLKPACSAQQVLGQTEIHYKSLYKTSLKQ